MICLNLIRTSEHIKINAILHPSLVSLPRHSLMHLVWHRQPQRHHVIVHIYVVACNCTHWEACTRDCPVLFIWCAMTSTSLDTTSHKATASTTLLLCCSFTLDAMPSPPLWMQVIWRCREEGEAIWTRPAVCHFNFITFHHPVQWIFMNIYICIDLYTMRKVAESV